jgi:hypothetical protein
MVEHGTYLVKDSYEDRWFRARPGWGAAVILSKLSRWSRATSRLPSVKHGVKIAFGTDAGAIPTARREAVPDYVEWG